MPNPTMLPCAFGKRHTFIVGICAGCGLARNKYLVAKKAAKKNYDRAFRAAHK